MTDPNKPAFACPGYEYQEEEGGRIQLACDAAKGLSIREYAAIKIMAGFAADPTNSEVDEGVTAEQLIEELAYGAVKWADALIRALNAPQ